MVLQYLPTVAKGLTALGGAAALSNMFKKVEPTGAETAKLQAIANQERLIKALTNPNDTVFKNLNALEQNEIRNAGSIAIEDLIRADRRQQLLGRRSFFNPERRDESINKYMNNLGSTAMSAGRNNAISRILEAITAYGSTGNQYGSLIPYQVTRQQQERERLPYALKASGDYLKNIYSTMNNGYSPMMGDREVQGLPWLS